MASIKQRGKLQFRAQVRRKGYPPQSRTFETKEDAKEWASEIERDMRRGIFISRAEAEATTLNEALTRYEREISSQKKGAAKEKSIIGLWRTTDLAVRSLASIRGTDMARLRDKWLVDYEDATVLRRLALVSHLFSIARKEWGMEGLMNPVEQIRKPRPKNARTRRINHEHDGERGAMGMGNEIEQIITASSSAHLPSIVRLAVETAMRRGELIELRWEHINLKKRFAHLPDTKNGSARDVPLSSAAIRVLEELPRNLNGKVFRVRADAVTRAFERAVDRARKQYEKKCGEEERKPDSKFLMDLCFHDLRHEATSRLAAIYPLHELAKITGHKDPRMLMRYYHPRAEELAKKLG